MNYGRYQVVKELGKGSMGIVYMARDPNLDLNVALKVLRTDRDLPESFIQRFLAEAKALGRLDHPHIVRVYNVDEDQGTVYIAMEFVEGEALSDIMKRNPFTTEMIIRFGIGIAEALDEAHRSGIVHRDVKPGNILVRKDGRPKITDFGIAHIDDSSTHTMTQAGEVLGTPAYMSPEQVLGKPVDGRSDLFSLGIILYELSTGTRPFSGENLGAIFNAITSSEPEPPIRKNPALPPALNAAILKCLNKAPADRFATGQAMAEALKACETEKAALQRTAEDAEGGKSRALLFAGIGAALLAAAAGGYFAFSKPAKVAPAAVAPAAPVAMSVLRVESVPPDASVFVDGNFRGKAPLRLDVARGKHEVRLTLPGHDDWEAQLQVEEADVPLSVTMNPGQGTRP
jgi:serine/threonine protein kinase